MKKLLALAMAIAVLSGCAATRPQARVAVYDFGLQGLATPADESNASSNKRLQASLLVTDASAPVSLDSTAIHYRLAYQDLARSYTYGGSRWAATPALLLTQQIRSRLSGISEDGVVSATDGALTNYTLRLDIEEFAQVFDTSAESRAVVRLRASLIERPTRLVMAQRSFRVEQPAPTPNAAGAVHALTKASDKLIGELIDWIVEELPGERKDTYLRDGIFSTDN
jgi:cholesterol transport system auxiliary component